MTRGQFGQLGPFAAVWVEQLVEQASAEEPAAREPTRLRFDPTPAAIVAAIATIRVEAPTFEPIYEYGGPSYWARYEGRRDLGNTQRGDGVRSHGRGFIQRTGRPTTGPMPPRSASRSKPSPTWRSIRRSPPVVFARYFNDRDIHVAAEAGNWTAVRQLVNGGSNGLDHLLTLVITLKRLYA